MPSELIVPVVEVRNVRPHPNADKLDLCDVIGFQMCVNKGGHKNGDRVVFFPPDTVIPPEWADKFGVRKYLKGPNNDRVGSVKLRGEPSAGLAVPLPDGAAWELGLNVADYYGCKKYIPPVKQNAGDAEKYDSEIDPFFHKFTNIQNGRIIMDILVEGEPCIYTEKIHGTNCRVGIIEGTDVAGSMEARRRCPWRYATETCVAGKVYDLFMTIPWLPETVTGKSFRKYLLGKVPQQDYPMDSPQVAANTYWYPWSIEAVRHMLWNMEDEISTDEVSRSIILYGEVFGPGIQSLHYSQQKPSFAVFGLSIDGRFMNWDDLEYKCATYGVKTVPVLYRGPYSLAKAKELANGKSTMADHIREGVVVYPENEHTTPVIGRAVVKVIGDDYAASRHKETEVAEG